MKADKYETRNTIYLQRAAKARRKAAKACLAETEAETAGNTVAAKHFKREAELYRGLARTYENGAASALRTAKKAREEAEGEPGAD